MINLFNKNSLLTQLLLRIFAIGIVAVVITFAFINMQIDRSLEVLRDETVEEQAQSLQTYLKAGGGVNKVTFYLPDAIRVFYAKAGPSYQYLVRDGKGNVLFRSPFAYNTYFPSDFTLGNQKFDFMGPAQFQYVGYTLETILDGKRYYIQVAQTQKAADTVSGKISDTFMMRLLAIGIPFYAALFWIIMTTLKRRFKPLFKAANEVSQVTVTNPDIHISETNVPDEVLPFVRAVNFSFQRLGKAIREQREFTENLAHELRTPLAILKAHIELLGNNPEVEKVGQDVDNMIQLVNQMLDMTRLEYADTIEMKEVDLTAIVSQVCQDLWPLYLKNQRELRVTGMGRPVMVMGDKDLIYRAVRNLLDNALEHSPAKTPVEVIVENGTVRVRDFGRSIPENVREKIFNRFHRDNGKGRNLKGGAGLGLSIVRRTMEVHGGNATVEPAGEAGNIFSLHFKRARPLHGKLFEVRSL